MGRLQGRRIFVVEDDAFSLGIVITLLEQEGASVRFDGWGLSTLSRIENFMPIDLVLMDIHLPNTDGFTVFDEIRHCGPLQDLKVVAMTASDPAIMMKKARERGFAGFVSKPIRMKTFAQTIATILNGQEVWDAL
jgi:two-component system, cell cycle response regulator DivK